MGQITTIIAILRDKMTRLDKERVKMEQYEFALVYFRSLARSLRFATFPPRSSLSPSPFSSLSFSRSISHVLCQRDRARKGDRQAGIPSDKDGAEGEKRTHRGLARRRGTVRNDAKRRRESRQPRSQTVKLCTKREKRESGRLVPFIRLPPSTFVIHFRGGCPQNARAYRTPLELGNKRSDSDTLSWQEGKFFLFTGIYFVYLIHRTLVRVRPFALLSSPKAAFHCSRRMSNC